MISLRKLNNIIRSVDSLDLVLFREIKQDLIRLYNLPNDISDEFGLFLMGYIKSFGDMRMLSNYINRCGFINFNIDRYGKYVEYKEVNSSDSSSETFHKLTYGDEYLNKYLEKNKNRNNMYDPNYISLRDGISIEKAIEQIENFKKNKNTSLNGFIGRNGVEVGTKMFNKFQETSKHTLEKFIDKFGQDDGVIEYDKYLSKKDSMSMKWAMGKTNGDVGKAKVLVSERKLSVKTDFNKILQKFDGNTELAKEYYEDLNERKKNKSYSSKESMTVFNPIYDELLSMGYSEKDIFVGFNTNEKYFYDMDYNRGYFYDFTNMFEKYIIEYNGEYFHPRIDKYDISTIMEKHNYFYDVGEKIEYDKRKINFIEQMGYKVLVLWSEDGVDYNTKKCKEFINKNKTIV